MRGTIQDANIEMVVRAEPHLVAEHSRCRNGFPVDDAGVY